MSHSPSPIIQIETGIPGLDELLRGGYVKDRMYLLVGGPGTGKTTLGLHFLEQGLSNDETVLMIHGEETPEEITVNADQFGIELEGAEFLDLGPDSDFFTDNLRYDLVNPADIQEEQYTTEIHEAIESIDPTRIVIDPITQLRHFESTEYYYRKRILSFMRFLKKRGVTVLATATADSSQRNYGAEIRSLSDGVIKVSREGGGRRVEVQKNRGIGQVDDTHALEIRSSGVEIFPKVYPRETTGSFVFEQISSGIEGIDTLVNGGFERGTVTFISGPPGVGKTTISTLFLTEAAKTIGKSVIYLFEERLGTFTYRCDALGIPVEKLQDEGVLSIEVIEPQEYSSEEFAHNVRSAVEEKEAETVMIDGIGGYASSIKGVDADLEDELHLLTRYLVNQNVTVFVTDAIHQMTGLKTATSREISPIADNLMFLGYVEIGGALRKVIGVLKKRAGTFEYTLREFEIDSDGVVVGEPMSDYQGLLEGVATHTTQ